MEQQNRLTDILAQIDQEPSKEETVEYLKKLRSEFLAEVAKGKNPEELAESCGDKMFVKGVKTMKVASLTIQSTTISASVAASTATGATVCSSACSVATPGPIGIIIVGVIYSA